MTFRALVAGDGFVTCSDASPTMVRIRRCESEAVGPGATVTVLAR
jgi:hypothetical protein